MNKKYQTAYDQLKELGVTVYEDEGGFRISGEDNYPIIWAEYYTRHGTTLDEFGVNHEINDILAKQGLFAEWENTGVLGVAKM
jgi:hypothetical protein|tara:strand:+ start:465 stop:713 length:249 start_codon:yes stop_codon:yes gene_type:complete